MLIRRPRNLSEALRDERGFSLVELLVILSAGLVVFGALFTVLDTTLRQTSRVVSQVDATQQARSALERIEQELQSSCVGGGAPPIQATSDGSVLKFISGYGSDATVTPVWHEITYNGTSGAPGTLVDSEYSITGSAADPAPGTPLGSRTLLGRVGQQDPSTPIFKYYAYETPKAGYGPTDTAYLDPSGFQYRMLLLDNQTKLPSGATLSGSPAGGTVPGNSPLALIPPLSEDASTTDPNRAAAVLTTLNVYPERGSDVNANAFGAAGVVSNLAVLRLTPVANHAGGAPNVVPCA